MSRPPARRQRQGRKVVVQESTGRRIFEQSRIRLLCVGLFFILCFGSISARLVEMMFTLKSPPVQITVSDIEQGREFSEKVAVEADKRVTIRGDIVDRNGELLATSLITASLFANPRELRDPQATAKALARALPGLEEKSLLGKFDSDKTFVWVKRNLMPAEQQAVNDLGVPGLYFLPEERRVYPHGNVMSHVLGYVGLDNKGLSGIEKTEDGRLNDRDQQAPLALSIDMRVQHIVYDELHAAIAEFKAIGGTGVVADARNGEILAMVSLPDFDPHRLNRAKDYEKFNRASLGSYEMGSTFKSFTAAMALDAGVTSMKGQFDATAPLHYAGFTIDDTHPKRRWLSVPEVYAYSSNIGTARMAMASGIRRQKEFLERFGMFQKVDIELPERAQPMYPADWKELSLITISYGHGISVSPLHLVRGVTALVNGGLLPTLTLLKDGNMLKQAKWPRVIKPETSQNMRRLMRMVVQHGTASKADVPGYRVGGKTGTAEKISAGGGYNANSKMALFVSTFPVDDPQYVILVMVDEPQGNKETFGYATGGWISAPVVARIIQRMAPLQAVRPQMAAVGDDAERYWVDTEKPRVTPAAAKPTPKDYFHAASFPAR